LVGLASILTVVQTLRPLRRLSQQARTIGPGTSSERLNEADAPREVLPLVQAVNGAVDRLDQAFEAQRAFTADAAHELRTPLAILKMRLDGLPPCDIRQDLERDVAVMERLVSQLLKGARLETLALLASDRADLCHVAQEVAETCALMAVRRRISLELDRPDGAVDICGQRGPLYDALRNLVENAMAKTPPGKRVLITVTPYSLTVADQGPGIPAQERPYLFQRFWQGRDKTGGAGLGLSIVQRVADLHRATLTVQDTPGGGATFVISFPPPPTAGLPDQVDNESASHPLR
jgi:signal transduction histidine kinase